MGVLFAVVIVYQTKQLAQLSRYTMDIIAAKNLKEVAEYESLRDKNKMALENLLDAQKRASQQETRGEGAFIPPRKITDLNGNQHNIADLELL